MKLIVGLGNKDEKYQNNRHNVGFHFLDFIIENPKSKIQTCLRLPAQAGRQVSNQVQNPNFQKNKKLNAEIYQLSINNEKIILVKPQSFMNNSGQAVKSCVTRYTLNVAEDIYVIHDDLDLRLGEFKIQKGKGPKLHNGILSIEQVLKTSDFWRIRIGVDNRGADNRIPGEKYVLQNFKGEELKILEDVFKKIVKSIYTNRSSICENY